MSKARKGGLGRGLDALISSTGSKPISRPSDVFFPETNGSAETSNIPRGGSARDLLLPGGKSSKRRSAAHGERGNGIDGKANVSRETKVSAKQDSGVGAGAEGVSRETTASVSASASSGSRKSDSRQAQKNVSRETVAKSVTKNGTQDTTAIAEPVEARDVRQSAADAGVSATLSEIEISSIHPNAKQPRTIFDESDLEELAASIKEVGVLQPIVVRPDGDSFELIMGERRWRASQRAGRTTIPAIIRWTDDDDMLRDALLENLHRAQLNPLEEAAAYQQLLEDFGCSQTELAKRIARSRPVITNTMRLLQLPGKVQNQVAAGVLSAGHARALLSLTDQADMEVLADRIISEGLSVRSTEEIVSLGDIHAAPKQQKTKSEKKQKAAPTPYEANIANSLSELLETRVAVNVGAKRGKITVEFADTDDLERIVNIIQGMQSH